MLHQQDTVRTITIIDYIRVLAKRRRMIFLVTVAACLVSLIYSLFLHNVYTARALLLPAQEDKGLMNAMMSQIGGLSLLAGGGIGGTTTSDLYVSMLKSETIKDPIIEQFKLKDVYNSNSLTDIYATLDKNVSIVAGKKDSIVTISVEDHNPKRAAEIANAYVMELQKLTVALNISGAGQNRTFLQDRLAKAKVDLSTAEEALKTFQSKNKSINVTEQVKATIGGVAQLRAELALQEVKLSTLRRTLTDSNQKVKNLATSIEYLKRQIEKMEGNSGGSAIPSIGSMPALGQEYVRLFREVKIQETLVEILTRQYELARLSEAKDLSPFQVLQHAKAPDKKSKPKRALLVSITTFSAFIFSIFLAFIIESYDALPPEEKARLKNLK